MGRMRGLGGLDLPGLAPEGAKEVNAKLILPTGSPLLEADPTEVLLPYRLCFLPSSSKCGGTRTMVSRLDEERPGLRLTDACSPHGSAAVTDPRLAERRRGRDGPSSGLWDGECSTLETELMVLEGCL